MSINQRVKRVNIIVVMVVLNVDVKNAVEARFAFTELIKEYVKNVKVRPFAFTE
jgi:hypothetical protein